MAKTISVQDFAKNPNTAYQKKMLSNELRLSFQKAFNELGNNLLGRILTLCDASFADQEQRKAFKDVLKEIMYDVLYGGIEQISISLKDEVAQAVGDSERIDSSTDPTKSGLISVNLDELDYTYTRQEK